MQHINLGNMVMCQYLLRIPTGYVAIDTGYSGGYAQYRKALQRRGIDPTEIKILFLTHAHDDHAGFLSELLSASKAILIVDKEAPARLVEGHNRWVGGCSGRLAKAFVQSMKLFGKGKHAFPSFEISKDTIVWDRHSQPLQDLGVPASIVSLPGHTADSIGILTDDGQLFCGDAAMNGFPSVHRNIIWIESLNDYKRSWDAMIATNAQEIFPAHGKPFSAVDLVRYRASLENLKLW